MYDELVERLRASVDGRYEKCDGCPYVEDYPCCVDCLDKMHKQAADAIEELSKPRWIPVTERLPKADEYDARGYAVPYLVMNGWLRVTARRTKDYWVLFGNGTVLEYVTHWMPIPPAPKEET